MSDVLANLTAAKPFGRTSPVERLGSHADVNRHAQTARLEFSGLLDALAAAGDPKTAPPDRVLTSEVSVAPPPAPVVTTSGRDAARQYERTAKALER